MKTIVLALSLVLSPNILSARTFSVLNPKVSQGDIAIIKINPQWQGAGVGVKGPCADNNSKSILPNKFGWAFIPISVDCEPGNYRVFLTVYEIEAQTNIPSPYIEVIARNFSEWFRGRLPVMSKATQQRLQLDQDIKNMAYALANTWEDYTSGKFIPPLDIMDVTDEFGSKRIYGFYSKSKKQINIESVVPHGGVDLKAKTPTKVMSVNSGQVLLAKHLLADGNILIIDHGSGILSLYLHLSRFLVREGDMVKVGQVVAYTGSTGNVPPHLHFMIKTNGINVDPLIFIDIMNQLVK